jgi:hypothetical protein
MYYELASIGKRLFPFFGVSIFLLTTYYMLHTTAQAWAAPIKVSVPRSVKVSASVGEFRLNLSGWMSPYASIVLSSNGIFMGATVADKGGNWSFIDILINHGFSQFCLTAIDFYRLGESTTCFNIKPADSNVTMQDIFLPPTLGLSRNEVAAGGKVLAFGYTMPGAKVYLHLSDGRTLETFADGNGYYVFSLENIPAGKYQLYATANYKAKDSLKPSKTIELVALGWFDQFLRNLARLWAYLVDLFTSIGLGPLWIGLPLLLLIVVLILKLWPERFTFIYESKLLAWLPKREKTLHHAWMFGY